MSEQVPSSEERPTPHPVEVEISDYTNEYSRTWRAVYEADTIIGLANQSLLKHGFELVPLWRGHYLHEPEVVGLLDSQGIPHDAEPVPDHTRVSMSMAARAVVVARLDEIEKVRNLVGVMWATGEIHGVGVYSRIIGHLSRRKTEVIDAASNAPERGDA